MNIDDAKECVRKILKNEISQYSENLSETDTRCKLVDAVLIKALDWQEHSIEREPHVAEPHGYIDYLLHTSRPAYVIEAKKRSLHFSLPKTNRNRNFKIGGVLSDDKNLLAALKQCRDYATSKGTSFCCVTNGLQYIFFRSHSDLGVSFENHQAIIFDGADDILGNFQLFYKLLSFVSVSEGHHIGVLPVTEIVDNSSRFKELSAQSHRLHYKNRNRLEPFIRSVVTEVFQDLADDKADIELIEQCYVESSSQGSYEQSFKSLIKNKPTLADGKVKPVHITRRAAGEFDKVLDGVESSKKSASNVVMLLGGIGAGKTTFLKRFRKVIARDKIEGNCLWIDINFNKYSDAPGELDKWVSNEIYSEVERNYPEFEFGSYSHLKQAYHPEYERLKRGRLAPIYANNPAEFEAQFSDELKKFESNSIPHIIKLLKIVQVQHVKKVFLVFDNADQFNSSVQNEVYMLANRLATEIGCSLIVSLREESYWKNKDFGALSAFHGFNFYIEAPDIKQVVAKRFRYASDLLKKQSDYIVPSGGLGVTSEEGVAVFESIRGSILDDPRFMNFLESLSPGEIRRPLDQLARFLFSGHTNIDSILRGIRTKNPIKIGFHEFVKSVSLGERETFSEDKSDLVNIFALDGSQDASNLNRLAVLGYLYSFRRDKSDKGLGFIPFNQVVDVCASFGVLPDTTLSVVQFLNARRLIETDQQIREFVNPNLYIRTTKAFEYYIGKLAVEFAYVDLVLPGTLIPHGEYFDMIERMSMQIYESGASALSRIERIEMRIDRARRFAVFMSDEAEKHSMFKSKTALHESVRTYVSSLDENLARQAPKIIENAKRVFSSARKK